MRKKWWVLIFIAIIIVGVIYYFRDSLQLSPNTVSANNKISNEKIPTRENSLTGLKTYALESNGYIIQYKEPAVLENDMEVENSEPWTMKVNLGLLARKQKIEEKHRQLRDDLSLIDSTAIVEREFSKVFSGASVKGINEEQAKNLERLDYVKKVYPNYIFRADLTESIPLINADDVWRINALGGTCNPNCKEPQIDETKSSKITGDAVVVPTSIICNEKTRCLTGKGTTIGIIDTGVDYTHEDLGGNGGRPINGNELTAIYDSKRDLAIYEDKIVWSETRCIGPSCLSNIYMYDISTGQEIQVTGNSNSAKFYISSDIYQNKIVWTDNRNGNYDIYMCDLTGNTGNIATWCSTLVSAGGGLKQITTNPSSQQWPSIYGNKIVWQDSRNGYGDIYMYDLSVGQEIRITNNPLGQGVPKIYGDKIVWQDGRDGNDEIYMYDLSVGQEIRITNNPFSQTYPDIYENIIVWNDERGQRLYGYAGEHYPGGLYKSKDIFMYDISTGQETWITENYPEYYADRYAQPRIDNGKIVWGTYFQECALCERRHEDIYMYDISTGQIEQMTCDFYGQFYPAIHNDRIVWLQSNNFVGAQTFGVYFFDLNSDENYCSSFSHPFPTEKVIGGYDFVNNDEDPMDDYWHGTHVAEIAAGNGVLKGVAPDANLYAFKVLNYDGSGFASDILSAIEMSFDLDRDGFIYGVDPEEDDPDDIIDIISMSLGVYCFINNNPIYTYGCGPDDPISQAVDNAVSNGVVAIVAAGNAGDYGPGSISSPGTARKAITVGATDDSDIIAEFSSLGPVNWLNEVINKPDVVAPGVNICSAELFEDDEGQNCIDDKHREVSGTSMATPHVSGLAALLLQKNPEFSPLKIKDVIKQTADDIGYDINTQGSGRINALSAVTANFVNQCGNNVREVGEECDGIDNAACPGNCLQDCTCSSCFDTDEGNNYYAQGTTSGTNGEFNDYCSSSTDLVEYACDETAVVVESQYSCPSNCQNGVCLSDLNGYVVSGYSFLYGTGQDDVYLAKVDSNGNSEWEKTYGSSEGRDGGYSVKKTTDGGYVISGYGFSGSVGDPYEFYLVKTDANGNAEWEKTYGSPSKNDISYSGQQTSEGGYILAGYSYNTLTSYNMQVVKTDANGNTCDYSANGNCAGSDVFVKTFGGSNDDIGYSIQQTSDGGYILLGQTKSFGAGNYDFWIVKTDANGNTCDYSANGNCAGSDVFVKTFGGSNDDIGYSIQQTIDGGYILLGITRSFGAGNYDFYLVKIDANGNLAWAKTYGGSGTEDGKSVQQTSDGGYILAGSTLSFGTSNSDFFIVKTDANGNTCDYSANGNCAGSDVFVKTFGGSKIYTARSVQQTSDGGYILAGYSYDTLTNWDVLLVKTDANGNSEWEKVLGSVFEQDLGFSAIQI